MARTGDEDEIGYGASVAYLSDVARRRAERGDPSPDEVAPAPDPDAGIELITSLDAGDDDVEESADDADRALARQQDAALRVLPDHEATKRESQVDPAGRPEGEQRGVREVLEHHHERRDPRLGATITPRGSADLPPRAPQPSTSSKARSQVSALRTTRPRWRVAGSLAAVVFVVVIVAIGFEVSSSTATHHRAPAAVTRVLTQDIASPISLITVELKRTSTAIGADAEIAASAHAAIQAKAKAQAETRARARAQAARRARAAARRRRAAAQRAHAASTAGALAAGSTQTTATDPVSPTPASSTSSASSNSSPSNDGGSGSSSAPAGPTAIGSAGGNCNPKCS